MLEVSGLVVGYGDVEALHGVSLSLAAGEVVSLVGANGAGKTTLLRAISGLLPVRAGRIELEGTSLAGQPPHRIAEQGIAHVPEGRQLFTRLTVEENLRLGAYLPRAQPSEAETLAWVLELFPRLADRRKQIAGTLSGGEQQMLAIARGLMLKPKLLLLDEPSLGLAPLLVAQIFETVDKINSEGVTVLLVEQNLVQSLEHSHRGYVLETGRVVQQGRGDELQADPRTLQAYLGIPVES
jgi:branched-chain amino acid transport system ATP-binding protein